MNLQQNTSLITLERDVFLRLVTYISPKALRSYIGLSEETFDRSKHIHFILYRLKFDELPISRFVDSPHLRFCIGRAIIVSNSNSVVFREKIFDEIFDVTLKYNGKQALTVALMTTYCLETSLLMQFPQIELSSNGSKIHFNRILTPSPDCEKQDKLLDGDELTLLVNMISKISCDRELYRTLQFRINGKTSRHVITKIPPTRHQIALEGRDILITLLTIKHLRVMPIQFSKNFIEWQYSAANYRETWDNLFGEKI
jgi:hypothetical protein